MVNPSIRKGEPQFIWTPHKTVPQQAALSGKILLYIICFDRSWRNRPELEIIMV